MVIAVGVRGWWVMGYGLWVVVGVGVRVGFTHIAVSYRHIGLVLRT